MIGRATVFSSPAPLAKKWSLSPEGQPVKATAAQMTTGHFAVAEFGSAHALADLLASVTTQQAVSPSLPRNGASSGTVTTTKNQAAHPGALARTAINFPLPAAPGVGFIDCDEAGISRSALWDMLTTAAPALAQAGAVWRPSGSSHIHHGDTDLTGLRGQHIAVMVQDVSDWPRVLALLSRRLWLAGHGRVAVSSAGSLLLRCPIDLAVGDPARLMFVGGSHCEPPLEQRRTPPITLSDGTFIDTRNLIPDLSTEDEARYKNAVERAKADALPEALRVRAEHRAITLARRLPELVSKGATAADAEARITQALDATHNNVLLADFELTVVQDGGNREVVTVGQVLTQPELYHLANCLDPLNPGYRDETPICRLYLLQSRPAAFSFAGGVQTYHLRREPVRLQLIRGSRSELVERLAGAIAANDDVFATAAGPVLLRNGRTVPLTVDRLMLIAGSTVSLYTLDAKGREVPTDLPREVAVLTLAALST